MNEENSFFHDVEDEDTSVTADQLDPNWVEEQRSSIIHAILKFIRSSRSIKTILIATEYLNEKLYPSGKKVSEIAEQFGVSWGYVYRIIRKIKKITGERSRIYSGVR